MSPSLRPERYAGLPLATAVTVTSPEPSRCSHAPDHAEAWAPLHSCISVADALALSPQCAPPANAGMAKARASAAAAETFRIFLMFPPRRDGRSSCLRW